MKKEKFKRPFPGNIGSDIEDVVREETDLEGLPVIVISQSEEPRAKSQEPRTKSKKIAVRIMGENIRVSHHGVGQEFHSTGDIIENPWAGLLKEAEADILGRKYKIVHI